MEKEAAEIRGIEIANPLYDVVFKYLMENTHVASYFIETFIVEKIEGLTMLAQDIPVFKWSRKYAKFQLTSEDIERLRQITVIRLDFVATIKTEDGGYKKVLIEIQKARDTADVERFRTYLSQHYKRTDTITVDNRVETAPLPIITIYMLGFNLHESDAIVLRVGRSCHDMIKDETVHVKIPFVELLTHDSYMIQLGRITGKMRTRMEKVLSVFEQRYFIDNKRKTVKKYPHETDDRNVQLMLEILQYVSTDPEKQAEIDLEWASHDVLNRLVVDREKMIKTQGKKLAALTKDKAALTKDKTALTKDKAALVKDKAALTKDKAALTDQLTAKDNQLAEQAQEIAELKRQLGI